MFGDGAGELALPRGSADCDGRCGGVDVSERRIVCEVNCGGAGVDDHGGPVGGPVGPAVGQLVFPFGGDFILMDAAEEKEVAWRWRVERGGTTASG